MNEACKSETDYRYVMGGGLSGHVGNVLSSANSQIQKREEREEDLDCSEFSLGDPPTQRALMLLMHPITPACL